MNRLLILFVLIYILSPVDAMAGPIDDLAIFLLTYLVNKKKQVQ